MDRTAIGERYHELSEVLDSDRLDRSLRRISHEILERNASNLQSLALVGTLTRGVPLARRISDNIRGFEGLEVPVGSIDITRHRDDVEGDDLAVGESHVPFDVSGRTVVLVDDVLYTGRTARASMDALLELGRPAAIQLAILVDRGTPGVTDPGGLRREERPDGSKRAGAGEIGGDRWGGWGDHRWRVEIS